MRKEPVLLERLKILRDGWTDEILPWRSLNCQKEFQGQKWTSTWRKGTKVKPVRRALSLPGGPQNSPPASSLNPLASAFFSLPVYSKMALPHLLLVPLVWKHASSLFFWPLRVPFHQLLSSVSCFDYGALKFRWELLRPPAQTLQNFCWLSRIWREELVGMFSGWICLPRCHKWDMMGWGHKPCVIYIFFLSAPILFL